MTEDHDQIDVPPWYLGHDTFDCPYLPGRTATYAYVHGDSFGAHYRSLLDQGYRRNGRLLYRPICADCDECKVSRVPVNELKLSKSQRRLLRAGEKVFDIEIAEPRYSEAKARMYEAYLRYQHNDEQPIDEARYNAFFVDSCVDTIEVNLVADEALAGVGLVDRIGDALSTVYFYFDPAYAEYSPGTYSVLAEIELARLWGLAYYYLGYYIADCAAMNYKTRFRPCELKSPDSDTWRRVG